MKKVLSLLLTVIFTLSLGTLVYAHEVKSTKHIFSSEDVGAIKSAEQSVLDFFAAVENNDYDAVSNVSMDKRFSDEMRKKTIELQHEERLFAEKIAILSSEKHSEDMIMVSVSFVMDGQECLMTYPVVLVNNKWIVNVGAGVDPSARKDVIITTTPEIDNSIKGNFTWLWFTFRKIFFIFTGI